MLGLDVMRDRIRRGVPVADLAFDRLFPIAIRGRSPVSWTPVGIALRATEMLAGAVTILDVGAGAGKACLVGALAGDATWTGIEQDATLVDAARAAALQLDLDRARFVCADALAADWTAYDAIYLFNPFASLRARADPAHVQRACEKLAALRPGTRVLTYHGIGGDLPDALALVAKQRAGSDELALWTRR